MSELCNECYWPLEDDGVTCSNRNCPTHGGQGGKRKKKKDWSKLLKPLAIGAAGIAAVGGIIFGVINLFGTSALGTAAQNSVSSLVDELRTQSNLSAYLDGMEVLDAKSDRTVVFGIKDDDSIIGCTVNYAGSKKLAEGTFSYQDTNQGVQLELDFHANKKELRLMAPNLVSDTYGLTYSDFAEVTNFELEPFKSFDLEKFLKEQAGDSWDAFVKTLEIEEYSETELTLGSRTETCTVYRVLWDSAKAQTMFKNLFQNTFSILPDFLVDMAAVLEPDLRCYVDSNENLVGVDFTFLGKIYKFLLEGETNPWESFSLEVLSATTPAQRYTGGLISDSTGARIELKANDQTVYAIYYDNTTGAYSIVSPEGEITKGVFQADDSGMYLECSLASKTYLFGISTLTEKPENVKTKYVDLLDMGWPERSRLLAELCTNLGVSEDFFGFASSFFGIG